MAAYRVFNEVLNKIEASQLNYVITKTPFSANIVMKSSFIKYFDEATSAEIVKTEPEVKVEDCEISKKLVTVKQEKRALENMFDIERDKVKAMEGQVGDYRDELLKIKKEKHELNAQLKSYKTQLSAVKEEHRKLSVVNKDLEHQVLHKTEKLETKHHECKELSEINASMKTELDECLLKLDTLKIEPQVENKNDFVCAFCDNSFESRVQLSGHVRKSHVKHQVSQTSMKNTEKCAQTEDLIENDDLEHPCFYCGERLTDYESNMEMHLSECCELGSVVFEDAPIFPCDQCNDEYSDISELKDHYTKNHPECLLCWCDFCGSRCENLEELQTHIRSLHRNILPQ